MKGVMNWFVHFGGLAFGYWTWLMPGYKEITKEDQSWIIGACTLIIICTWFALASNFGFGRKKCQVGTVELGEIPRGTITGTFSTGFVISWYGMMMFSYYILSQTNLL